MSKNKLRLNKTLFKLITDQFIEYWYLYIIAITCLFLTHTIQALIPVWAGDLAVSFKEKTPLRSAWYFFAAASGIIAFRTGSRYLFFLPARMLQRKLRLELLVLLESVTPLRLQKFSKGQLFQLLGNDIDQLRSLIGFALLQIGNIIVALWVLTPKLMQIHPSLFYSLFPMFISLFFFIIVMGKNRRHYRSMQDSGGDVKNFIMESYAGKETINTFNVEKIFSNNFALNSIKELNNFYKAGLGIAITMPLMTLGLGASLILGAVIIKQNHLGQHSLITFSGFIYLFTSPLLFLIWIGAVASSSLASWQRLKEVIFAINNKSEIEKKLELINSHHFADKEGYHQLKAYLWDRPIEVKILKNGFNVFSGQTGAGKTTLLEQIANLYKMNDIKISYVAQTPYVYSDSIINNIFLGKEYTDEDWKNAYSYLKMFGLDNLASTELALKDIEVGEHGKMLSGGQAKRLRLIRSLVLEAEIIIWDDPFSSVDILVEKEIIDKLKERHVFKNKTVIMTSHRLSSVKYCDELYLLAKEKGILESGKVSALLDHQSGSLSYEYFKKQTV